MGATLAGPARRGEILTDARVLGSRLAGLSAGPDARVVPLHLADAAVLDLIRPGDVVDVLGAPAADTAASPRVLASRRPSWSWSRPPQTAPWPMTGWCWWPCPPRPPHAVAGASLVQTVTLTIH